MRYLDPLGTLCVERVCRCAPVRWKPAFSTYPSSPLGPEATFPASQQGFGIPVGNLHGSPAKHIQKQSSSSVMFGVGSFYSSRGAASPLRRSLGGSPCQPRRRDAILARGFRVGTQHQTPTDCICINIPYETSSGCLRVKGRKILKPYGMKEIQQQMASLMSGEGYISGWGFL